MAYPPLPVTLGKKRKFKDIDGNPRSFVVEGEIRRIQSNDPGKAIYLQCLRFEEENRTELRLGYYMIARKPRMAGKWAWGQFAAMLPVEDFKAVISEAQSAGWL